MKTGTSPLAVTRFIALLVLVLSLTCGGGMGQRYQAMTYTETDGLASSMAFGMVQDTAGVIWIGRRSGISSYNGSGFSNYNVTDGLRSSSYACLFIDEKQTLWALPESGTIFFSKLVGTKWKNIAPSTNLTAEFKATYTSLDVFYDHGAPVMLAGTEDQGFIVCRENRWTQYTKLNGLQDNMVNSIREFEGLVYIATEKGLAMLDKGVIKPVHDPASPQLTGNIVAMERKGKTLWLLGDGWLGSLTGGKFSIVTSGFILPVNGLGRHCFMHAGRNGKIYFGNSFKVFSYTPSANTMDELTRNNGLISEGGTSVLVDREMNVWITGYRGITKIPSQRFASYTDKDGLCSNEVASAIEMSPGRYVFGHDGALTFFDGKTMTPLVVNQVRHEGNYETRVLDLQKDGKGMLWMAVSSLGIASIDKNRHVTWYREKEGLTGTAYTVAVMPSGDLYAGTTHGLFRYGNGRFNKMDLGTKYNHTVRKIISDKDGTLFMATITSGLIILKGNELSSATAADNPLANNVFAFFTDSKNRQWTGTAAGLYLLTGKELKRVDHKGLMINRPVYLIMEDHGGNLWFGADNGVYRWNGNTLDHFTVNDGLSGQDINRAAGIIDARNHVWFGTNNGVTVFRPELDYKPGEVPPPKVCMQQIMVGKDTLDRLSGAVLNYDLNDLSFHARVISLINERQVLIRYYLAGFDTGWSNPVPYINNLFIYNNLSPGSYRFYLKAANSLGIWSDPVASGTITILPPFWLRWWFLTLSALIIAGMIIISGRFILISRYKNQLQEQVRLQTEELRKSEMQLKESNAAKDSFFSIIAHDLRNPFNAILGFLDLLTSDDSDFTEQERLNMLLQLKSASLRTINLLENLLTWARAQRGSLPFEPAIFNIADVIADNVALYDTAARTKNISLVNRVTGNHRVFADRNMISTVIRNLISNALKFTFAEGTITVGLKQQDHETIQVYVQDNGMGITPSVQKHLFNIEQRTIGKGTANETGTGLGLILCHEFVIKNKGTIHVTSTPGFGSTFTFTLPYRE